MGSPVKEDVVVLAGREFRRAKNGLDEEQVISFFNELLAERDRLLQSFEHIASLNRLAERAVVEADKLATQIKTEALEQAKAESAAILDKAKEEARQVSERKITEAVRLANEQANAIKAKAQEEAAKLLENEKNKIRAELRSLVNQQFHYMMEELENLKQQAAALQVDFDNKLSQPGPEGTAVAPKAAEEKDSIVAKTAEERDAAAAQLAKESAAIVAEELHKTLAEHPQPSPATNESEKGPDFSGLLEIEGQPESGKPQWEVGILPPFEIAKIMEVVSFLDQLPEVASTEMIVPQLDAPSILVFLRKPIDLVNVLRKIPAVAHIEEVAREGGDKDENQKKVRVNLSADKKSPGTK